MKTTKHFCTIVICFLSVIVAAQTQQVKGKISAGTTADVSIYRVFPDSFPNVSVIFKAETRNGDPVWGLNTDNIIINEDNQKCNIVSLQQISASSSVNIGIIIDHSGSMSTDSCLLDSLTEGKGWKNDAKGHPIGVKGYISPLDNAKMAVKTFIKSFNASKDYISVIGFSADIDWKCKLTHDKDKVNSIVDSMQADGGTALYDAMLQGVKMVAHGNGLKALVVLTDGRDNESHIKYSKVIRKANSQGIPIYFVCLGDADKDTLRTIANATKGKFYYTSSTASLSVIYKKIRKDLKAYYEVVYRSQNFAVGDTNRKVEVSFDIKNITPHTSPFTTVFAPNILSAAQLKQQPDETVNNTENEVPTIVAEYVESKEAYKEYYVYGSVAVSLAISAGTVLFKTSKAAIPGKQNDTHDSNIPIINKLYPNPTNGPITITCKGKGQLVIINLSGTPVKTIEVSGQSATVDMSDLPDGEYLATIFNGTLRSNTQKFIVQR